MHFLDILFCIFRKLLQRVKSTSEDAQSYLPVLNTQREMYILFYAISDEICFICYTKVEIYVSIVSSTSALYCLQSKRRFWQFMILIVHV